jgi:hypothetical protein
MDDLSLRGERRMGGKLGLNAGRVANQNEPHSRMADERNRGGGNDHAWSVVPAHGVKRDGDWRTHFSNAVQEKLAMQRDDRGNPRK